MRADAGADTHGAPDVLTDYGHATSDAAADGDPDVAADTGADKHADTAADGAPNVEADADADYNAASDCVTFSDDTFPDACSITRPNDSSPDTFADVRADEPAHALTELFADGLTVSPPDHRGGHDRRPRVPHVRPLVLRVRRG